MHPLVESYVRKMEAEAAMKGSYRNKIGVNEIEFLEQVWGPEFEYRFEGLTAEFPFKDYQGKSRFADFVYVRGSLKLLVEVDDFTTHANPKHITVAEFSDHQSRQNDLILAGWIILRFTTYQIKHFSMVCRRQLKQAIGMWWVNTQAENPYQGENRANMYRSRLIQLAIRENRPIRTSDVARTLQISRTAAKHWLDRFTEEGIFTPIEGTRKITGYQLNTPNKKPDLP